MCEASIVVVSKAAANAVHRGREHSGATHYDEVQMVPPEVRKRDGGCPCLDPE